MTKTPVMLCHRKGNQVIIETKQKELLTNLNHCARRHKCKMFVSIWKTIWRTYALSSLHKSSFIPIAQDI